MRSDTSLSRRLLEHGKLARGLRSLLPRPARRAIKRLLARPSGQRSPKVEKVRWGNLRRTAPFSSRWGFDRGQPIERFYIHDFLQGYSADIGGEVLEVQDPGYTRMFGGSRVTTSHILDVNSHNPDATIIGDLSEPDSLPAERFDCFIMTQTLHLVPDVEIALKNAWRALAPGGTLLVSVSAAAKVDPQYRDAAQWRFTPNGLERMIRKSCPDAMVEVRGYGNVLTAIASLMGLAAEDLTESELRSYDSDFPVTTCARLKKAVDE